MLFPAQSQPRGVNAKKIENIVEILCPHMEPVKRQFWLNITKSDDAPDLQFKSDLLESDNEDK